MARGDAAAVARAAGRARLVATVPARDDRVAELVRRQALAVVAAERALRAFCEIFHEEERWLVRGVVGS